MNALYNTPDNRYNLKRSEHIPDEVFAMKIVVVISAFGEWEAVKGLFPDVRLDQYLYGECFEVSLHDHVLTFFHTGWGKTASAGALQYILDHYAPDFVINLGTCGGFAGVTNRGDVILVERTFIYDIVELMDSADVTDYYASSLDLSWLAYPDPFPVRRGLIASADSDLLPEKIPLLKSHGALAADWESASLAWVARKNNARLLILREVSDIVSEEGGEVYDQIEIFNERAKEIMQMLVNQLPGWVSAVKL
jgi:adenosylhomocysteine nucleosidase